MEQILMQWVCSSCVQFITDPVVSLGNTDHQHTSCTITWGKKARGSNADMALHPLL